MRLVDSSVGSAKRTSSQQQDEFAAGVTPPLIHCYAGLTHRDSQHDRLHLISYNWKHKLAPMWFLDCVVFIFIDQTAKFSSEACVPDVAIKAEPQKKKEPRMSEMRQTDPLIQLINWPPLLRKRQSFFTTRSLLKLSHHPSKHTHSLFVRLGQSNS